MILLWTTKEQQDYRVKELELFPSKGRWPKLGHFPTRETDKEAWFLSPFRSENQASFKVCKKLNNGTTMVKESVVMLSICMLNQQSLCKRNAPMVGNRSNLFFFSSAVFF